MPLQEVDDPDREQLPQLSVPRPRRSRLEIPVVVDEEDHAGVEVEDARERLCPEAGDLGCVPQRAHVDEQPRERRQVELRGEAQLGDELGQGPRELCQRSSRAGREPVLRLEVEHADDVRARLRAYGISARIHR